MMYNRLIGGLRLRQLRVRNDSCTLSSGVIIKDAALQSSPDIKFDLSLVFPAENLDGGSCFAPYTTSSREERPYGPCTEKGREKLVTLPDYDKYNTSCVGSGFEFEVTDAPPWRLFDAGGYVRDVLPPENSEDNKVRRGTWA